MISTAPFGATARSRRFDTQHAHINGDDNAKFSIESKINDVRHGFTPRKDVIIFIIGFY